MALMHDGALPVTAAALEERLAPCLACHGEKGQSQQPEVPSLGAQPAFYVMVQLYMFRERLRIVEVMNAMTQRAHRRRFTQHGRRHCATATATPGRGTR